jgi:hypothetical protein
VTDTDDKINFTDNLAGGDGNDWSNIDIPPNLESFLSSLDVTVVCSNLY